MEENESVEDINTENHGSSNKFPIIIIIFLILAVAVVFVLNKTKDNKSALALPSTVGNSNVTTSGTGGESQLSEEENVKTIEVKASSYSFDPKTITVKEGKKVKIVLSNGGGMHDFVIDEFNVKSKVVNSGETTEVIFTADKKGQYEYYCNIANHRAMGMVGKLIVE